MKTCRAIRAFLLIFTLTAGCSDSSDSSREKAGEGEGIPVRLGNATLGSVAPNVIRTSGTVRAEREVRLSFELPGEIATVSVTEGAFVSKGEALARLDQTLPMARVEKAGTAFEKAQRDLTRLEKLLVDSVVTIQQVQDARSLLNNARTDLEIARHGLAKSTLTAPFSGRIRLKLVEEKEIAVAGMPAFVLTDLSSVKIELGVPDDQISRIGTNDPVTVLSDAYPNKVFEGKVTRKAVASDPLTGTFSVEARVPNSQQNLLPGMVVKVVLRSGYPEAAILIPIEGHVAGDAGAHYVFLYDPETRSVTRKQVEIGTIVGDKLQITSGIAEGDQIVISGTEYVQDGARVIVKSE